ncbi:MAG: DUF1836 domain-containing protein [Clostridiales bacterium]|jgi:DNA-binding transcriptional MerR regulator|nr:DUF1836 domain-containing protein [Clostridiales bacterium]
MRIPDKLTAEKLKGYNDEMTISQVVKYFERQGLSFTKTMIQNYVRVEVLPPPVNKRYYTKRHLLFLYIIDDLKSVFSLDEIKRVFAPVTADFENGDMQLIYKCYAQFYENYITRYTESENELKEEIAKLTEDAPSREVLRSICVMAESAAAKNIATSLPQG